MWLSFLGIIPDQRVVGLIPSHGTNLDCDLGPSLGAYARQPIDVSLPHLCFSPSLSPSLTLSFSKQKQKQEKSC